MECHYSVRKMDMYGKGPLFGDEIEEGTFACRDIREAFEKSREIMEECRAMVTVSTDKVKGWFEMTDIKGCGDAEFWTIEKIIYRETK